MTTGKVRGERRQANHSMLKYRVRIALALASATSGLLQKASLGVLLSAQNIVINIDMLFVCAA